MVPKPASCAGPRIYEFAVIVKTDAIVLRINKYSNTSQIVTWLSRDAGRLVTLVKGACRSKSAFLGQYDLFYTCELLYYARERNGLHIARECAPLEMRSNLREDWRAMLSASYVCDAIDNVSENSPPGGEIFALLSETLNRLYADGSSMSLLLWFEISLLTILGFAPDLNGCPECLQNSPAQFRFSIANGRVICRACTREAEGGSVALTHSSVAAVRQTMIGALSEPSCFRGLTNRDLWSLRRFVGLFMLYHLELPLASRGIAWNVLE